MKRKASNAGLEERKVKQKTEQQALVLARKLLGPDETGLVLRFVSFDGLATLSATSKAYQQMIIKHLHRLTVLDLSTIGDEQFFKDKADQTLFNCLGHRLAFKHCCNLQRVLTGDQD